MDHDRDDMNDLMASIPPSISLGQPKLPGLKTTNYGALLENEHNLFDGMLSADLNSGGSMSQLTSSASKQQLSLLAGASNVLPAKRTLNSLYWNDDVGNGNSPPTKRFLADSSDGSMATRNDENASIASLLSQLPQTPSLHQQSMLGSLGDGVFRQPYQVSGMNWYS